MDALVYGRREYGLHAIRGDGVRLPFPDSTFDAIIWLETLEHVPDGAALIWELSRVLRIGGTLHLTTPNVDLFAGINPHHLREYGLGELLTMLDRAGLKPLRYWGQHVQLRDRIWRNVKGFRRIAFELYQRPWVIPGSWIFRADPVYPCIQARRADPSS
jgi:SAM-dependent methyltransferase